jgi:hypothetical protein
MRAAQEEQTALQRRIDELLQSSRSAWLWLLLVCR